MGKTPGLAEKRATEPTCRALVSKVGVPVGAGGGGKFLNASALAKTTGG